MIAPLTLARDYKIRFCPSKDLADPACIVEPMEFDVCKYIPNSNAMGDNGSWVSLLNTPGFGGVSCIIYQADDLTCKGPNSDLIYGNY
ncbi:hypothetical protein OHC33_009089 [Knufia fluminis]|uniref:Uncharacterized protein n=2 Tax=Knufia TaxID=430999 RepID=A0AAN8E9M2_9EURO|nr:hypothetical protein OHC33_009089 [Knufia fluminis]